MKKIYLIITLIFISGSTAFSQSIDFDNLLEGGVQNGNKLLEGYLSPAFAGMGYAMNAGWYNTAKPHKLLGFDVTFTSQFAMVPSSANYFSFNASAYDNVTLENPLNSDSPLYGTNKLPTAFGPNLDADDIPFLVFNAGSEEEIKITAPTGSGIDEELPFLAVPSAALNVGVGLIKNTELKLRFLPKYSSSDGSFSSFGIGVMHDVKQWIPGIKNLPFDLSGFFGYTTMEAVGVIDEDLGQQAVFNVSGTTLQGVISKKLAILTVYGGLGFTTSKTTFDLEGKYDQVAEEDPISLTSNNGGMKANFGARIKLLILTFHAEYAFQEYNTFTAGVGLSIR